MDDNLPTIRVSDLTKLDELELRKQLGPESIRFEEDLDREDAHGEIATTTAIVIISLAALRLLAIHRLPVIWRPEATSFRRLQAPRRRHLRDYPLEIFFTGGSHSVEPNKLGDLEFL